jgi:hypothetical protein
MSLSLYTPLTEKVSLPRGISFDIRGLNSTDFRLLIETNLESFDALATMLDSIIRASKDNNLDMNVFKSSVVDVAQAIPTLLPQIIAQAADGDASPYVDRLTAASRMPMPLQLDLITKIGRLTFEEVGGVKKFLEEFGALKQSLLPPKTSSPTKSPKVKSSKSTTVSAAT